MAKKEKVELSDMDLEEDLNLLDLEEDLNLLDSKEDLDSKILRLETKNIMFDTRIGELLDDLDAQRNYLKELQIKLLDEQKKNSKANIFRFRVMSFIINEYLENYIRIKANNDILRNATALDLDDMERLNETISFNMGYKQSVMDLSKKLNLKIDFDE